MTFLEKAIEKNTGMSKDKIIDDYCPCEFHLEDGDCGWCAPHIEVCRACWNREYPEPSKETTDTSGTVEHDPINHPSHYTRGMEAIDEMIKVFGRETVAHFCLCNVWKYRKRALHKNGIEDLDKSDWYMDKYCELMREAAMFNG